MKLNAIKQEIEKILLDVTPWSFNEDTDTNFIITVLDKAKIRNYVDITDRLWLILKRKLNKYLKKKNLFVICNYFLVSHQFAVHIMILKLH